MMKVFPLVQDYLCSADRDHLFQVRQFQGHIVVPFEIVDSWHESTIGKAWEFFTEFRRQFLPADTYRWGGETFLTECGYAKLATRCYQDTLSWKIHQTLVEGALEHWADSETPERDVGHYPVDEPRRASAEDDWPDIPDHLPGDFGQ